MVVQEAFGVTDHVEDVCQRFADANWLAVAPYLFHRTGDPALDHTDFEAVRPVEDVEALRAAAASAAVPTGVVRYPDAGHGFHRDGSAAYHAASATDAWQRTLDWFARYMTTGASEVV